MYVIHILYMSCVRGVATPRHKYTSMSLDILSLRLVLENSILRGGVVEIARFFIVRGMIIEKLRE